VSLSCFAIMPRGKIMRALVFLTQLFLVATFSLLLTYISSPLQAGCGCDKPPPPPAAVIPNVAFEGLTLSIFHDSFKLGQTCQVTFHSNGQNSPPFSVKVKQERDLSDATGKTLTLRLTTTLPAGLPTGPASITVSRATESFIIPPSTFTIIGTP